jgi:hypothetical protein
VWVRFAEEDRGLSHYCQQPEGLATKKVKAKTGENLVSHWFVMVAKFLLILPFSLITSRIKWRGWGFSGR